MSNDVVDLEGKQQQLVDHEPGGDVHGHELLEQQLGSVGQFNLNIQTLKPTNSFRYKHFNQKYLLLVNLVKCQSNHTKLLSQSVSQSVS